MKKSKRNNSVKVKNILKEHGYKNEEINMFINTYLPHKKRISLQQATLFSDTLKNHTLLEISNQIDKIAEEIRHYYDEDFE